VQACGALPDSDVRKEYGNSITAMSYEWFKTRTKECGLPHNTVKLTRVERRGCYTRRCRAPALSEQTTNLGRGMVSMEVCSSLCGNGRHDDSRYTGLHEACDDGNIEDGDGCSSTCSIEPGWGCTTRNGTCGKTTCHSLPPSPPPPPPPTQCGLSLADFDGCWAYAGNGKPGFSDGNSVCVTNGDGVWGGVRQKFDVVASPTVCGRFVLIFPDVTDHYLCDMTIDKEKCTSIGADWNPDESHYWSRTSGGGGGGATPPAST
jgi:cysteine-rich repeat protein